MMLSRALAAPIVTLACFAATPDGAALAVNDDASWPQWRGPAGTGVAPSANPPTTWSASENVKWKVALPGEGHSSPIIVGDRVYLTASVKTDRTVEPAEGEEAGATEDEGRRGRRGRRAPKPTNVHEFIVLALNRADGAEVWRTKVTETVPHEGIHGTASFAPASPVTDGERLYVSFGSRGIYCLELDGSVAWRRDLGDMRISNSFGEGSSPALHGNVLVVPWDHEGDSFVYALDARTGEEIWKKARDERTTWSTPAVAQVGGAAQVIVPGTTATVAYDLKTGEEIWRCTGMTRNVIPTPIVADGIVYLTSGFRGSALQAVKLSAAKGDISSSEAILWSYDRGTPYVPSPVLSGDRLYLLRSTSSALSCFDAKTGARHYEGERLETLGTIYASPVGGGGKIYICDREGEVAVLEDSATFKVLATNSLGEGIDATPAIVGDEIYIRTSGHLYCIAESDS